jgi:OmpA-OmpF porin, OOP family
VGRYGTPFTLALGAVMTAPTGASDAFFGDGRFGVTPRLSAAGEHKLFLYAAQVGYAFRGGTLAGVAFHDELRFTASAGFRFFDRKLLVGPEVHGFVDFAGLGSGRPVGLEADLGAHYQVHPDVRLSAGGGAGLIRSPGVPDFRVLASVTWAPHVDPAPADRDGDGIADELDACPDVPHGPTPDALKPGCPELDADHDGVLDDADACPAVAQGPFPDPNRAGCPDADTDGDGVRDSKDLCPSVANGPQPDPKREGCPDGDADGDGVFDAVDDCPSTPAGLFADPARRGCPVADRDGDLVADVVDACPDTAGAPSTNPKKNGCPGLVKVEGGKIKILTPVNFATSKDVILPSSNAVLVAVADVMKSFPEIQHLAIEGHTDSQGKPAANKDLSQRRANSVLRWLVSHGIAAERLEAHGYGQEQPVADNKTDAGRATNRRVVFRIIEKPNE